MFSRTRFQNGSLRLKKRAKGPKVWEFRYYETAPNGNRCRKHVTIGTVEQYRTEAAARKHVQALLLRINTETPQAHLITPTMGALIERYKQEELPQRYSTRMSYLSALKNYIQPRWGDYPLTQVKAMAVEHWLKQLGLAPKSKAHIRSLLHLLFKCAERWELVEIGKNPIALVRVKDATKRVRKPRTLTVDEFYRLLPHLEEPYRSMVIVAQCLGLRVSEIVALKWGDFDFEKLTLLVQRSCVHGRVDYVKTEYSHDHVPIDTQLAAILVAIREKSLFRREIDWVFPNASTGKPFYQEEIQKKHLRRAARKAQLGDHIGWHTFRHTYRTLLDETGAPMKVQQELMRHASIQTTMNVYGSALSQSKRQANSKVVSMVLKGATGNDEGAALAAPNTA